MYDIFSMESVRAYLEELYAERRKLMLERELLASSVKMNEEEIDKVEIILGELEISGGVKDA
jgi:hypothetical protein